MTSYDECIQWLWKNWLYINGVRPLEHLELYIIKLGSLHIHFFFFKVTLHPSFPIFVNGFHLPQLTQLENFHTLFISKIFLNLSKSTWHQFVFNPFCHLPLSPNPNTPTLVQAFLVYFLHYSGFPAFDVSLTSLIQTAATVFSLNHCLVKKKGEGGGLVKENQLSTE